MESRWLKESLFAGMTANAFKLGTVLTFGWFWPRITGCSVLYRGSSMEAIDFADILAVAEAQADKISPPSYLPHNSNSIYFYIVRRVNNCGFEEHTLSAAVKISIDANGDIASPQPNSIFEIKAHQSDGDKIQLFWSYWPIEQESEPTCFRVYTDSRTGQIDYENPIAAISYTGRRFYVYQTDALPPGTYMFAVRAEDSAGREDSSLALTRIQLRSSKPDAIDILSAEVL
jgi:hypothetical protein